MMGRMIGQREYGVNRAAAKADFYRDEQDKRDRQDVLGLGISGTAQPSIHYRRTYGSSG